MEYQVFARKYRPGTFHDLIGQPHVVQTLRNAILGKRMAQAYLFSGMRGVGKTTVARILAKAVNCRQGPTDQPCGQCESCVEITRGHSVDVIEIDGASNTGVDDVRELRENIKFVPFHGTYRVYIIDEVHMLSTSAFNALLKTLEEPPSHAMFIFATTEIHKIPATILSRCQHFNFRRIPRLEIIQRLRHVATENQISIDDKGLSALARASDGSMRDALSLLDQAVAFGGQTLTLEDLEGLLGAIPELLVRELMDAIIQQDSSAAVTLVGRVLDQGHDLRTYCREVLEHVRNLLVANIVPNRQEVEALMDLPAEDIELIRKDARALTVEQLQEVCEIFSRAEDLLRITGHPRLAFEVAVIRATRLNKAPAPQTLSVPGKPSSSSSRESVHPAPASLPSTAHAHQGEKPVRQMAVSPPPSPSSPISSPEPARRATGPESQRKISAITSRATQAKADPLPEQAMPPSVEVPLDEEVWHTMVGRMMKEHPNIGSFLEMGTLVQMDSKHVVIGFPKSASVACSRIQKDSNRNLVAGLLHEIVGHPVQVRVIELLENQAHQPTMKQVRMKRQETEEHALIAEAKNHPFVKQALDVFGGDVVKARRLSTAKEE